MLGGLLDQIRQEVVLETISDIFEVHIGYTHRGKPRIVAHECRGRSGKRSPPQTSDTVSPDAFTQ
jgi:hypothetical protein